MVMERIFTRSQDFNHFAAQRRYPVGVVGVEAVGAIDKSVEVTLVLDGRNDELSLGHAGAFVQKRASLRMLAITCQAARRPHLAGHGHVAATICGQETVNTAPVAGRFGMIA